MKVIQSVLIATCLLLVMVPLSADADDSELETFTLSGNVYNSNGDLAAETSIKVDSMTSSWSDNGNYEFEGITHGEHTVRAYFMNDGHTVVYRKMFFESDMNLDWQEGKNWITAEMFDSNGNHVQDSPMSTVKLVDTNESHSLNNGRTEFGSYDIGTYFTMRAYYGEIDHSTQYVHFKLQSGSATEPSVNDFDFNHGKNSRYGFIKDSTGIPIPGVTISNGQSSTESNSDGFFLVQNMDVGSEQTFTFMQGNSEVASPLTETITSGEGWMNATAEIEINLPGNVSFTTQVQTIPMSAFTIEWQGSSYTESYSLYEDGYITYSGVASSFTFVPSETGTFEFTVDAVNSNGSTSSFQTLILIVLPENSGSDLWAAGMHWDYSAVYTPSHYSNYTVTAIGKESIEDAYGNERETYLSRITSDNDVEGEKAYRWVDTETLLTLHTYWSDAPSESSYFQEGTLGWDFTNTEGESTNLLDSDETSNLHFNRTNVIGVPGHPNGYDDTFNTVSITNDVWITTAAGNFSTTYIAITDVEDGVVSWELWYNDTVRNYVKIIDRLPGSHSDSKVSELTSFTVPITPQFLTEESNLSIKNYNVEWAVFQGADSYQLYENGNLIYSGENTSFLITDQSDGEFTYRIDALFSSGQIIEGGTIQLNVMYVVIAPTLYATNYDIDSGDEVTISWTNVSDLSWYSLVLQNADGEVSEIYNGTENTFSISELEVGLNRLRISASTTDGKVSEFSDSIFVNVEEKVIEDADSISVSTISLFAIMVLILFIPVILYSRGAKE